MLWRLFVLLGLWSPHLLSGADLQPPPAGAMALAWRLVNAEAVEIAWRVRSLQFFRDAACTEPISAQPNQTGDAFGTEAAEMTSAEHTFALQSQRGWETAEHCLPQGCQLGFSWYGSEEHPPSVRCLLLHQGEKSFFAPAISLQYRLSPGKEGAEGWAEAATWGSLEGGRAKLALACPAIPSLPFGKPVTCREDGPRTQDCQVQCDQGYGAFDTRMRCVNGAWYVPECLPIGSAVRLVPRSPELIKPHWVVLDATLYAAADCTKPVSMDGAAISSGEFVIKYANYHPKNAFDSKGSTSWASNGPCSPRKALGEEAPCWLGFRFRRSPGAVRCVHVEHPQGEQYQASSIAVEALGATGWQELEGVEVRMSPTGSQEL